MYSVKLSARYKCDWGRDENGYIVMEDLVLVASHMHQRWNCLEDEFPRIYEAAQLRRAAWVSSLSLVVPQKSS